MSLLATGRGSGTFGSIGRYFTVVSFVPSLLLVAWISFVANSGAWSTPPDWQQAVQSFARLSLASAFLLVLIAIAIGAALHPLQFTLVQLLEGYWGTSSLAIELRTTRTAGYDEKRRLLLGVEQLASEKLEDASSPNLTMLYVSSDEADRQLSYYPRTPRFLMPTRLGNVLRRYEIDVGSEYGLSVVTFIGHLAAVASPEQMRYVNDQRIALDFAVRCCLTGLLGSVVAVIFLWQHGFWLLVALAPYFLGYLAYRGSIIVAHKYGRALGALVDLNRFELYQRLRLVLPATTDEERSLTGTLSLLTEQHSPIASLPYTHPIPSSENPDPEQELSSDE